jgi:hypothetical protein
VAWFLVVAVLAAAVGLYGVERWTGRSLTRHLVEMHTSRPRLVSSQLLEERAAVAGAIDRLIQRIPVSWYGRCFRARPIRSSTVLELGLVSTMVVLGAPVGRALVFASPITLQQLDHWNGGHVARTLRELNQAMKDCERRRPYVVALLTAAALGLFSAALSGWPTGAIWFLSFALFRSLRAWRSPQRAA